MSTPISPLRQRMTENMHARKLTPETQRGHIASCKRFAAYLKRSPDTATTDIRVIQALLGHDKLDTTRQPPLGFLRAHRRRQLLRLLEVIDLG